MLTLISWSTVEAGRRLGTVDSSAVPQHVHQVNSTCCETLSLCYPPDWNVVVTDQGIIVIGAILCLTLISELEQKLQIVQMNGYQTMINSMNIFRRGASSN